MNKTALYGGLILGIAVIMVFSLVAPALVVDAANPALAFADGCRQSVSALCVAADPDRDGICNGNSFLMPIRAVERAGVTGFCTTLR